jgi:hypothetical protein
MIELARRMVESAEKQKRHSLNYLRGWLNYAEKRYEDAIVEFRKIDTHEAQYMETVSNLKLGRRTQAMLSLHKYHAAVHGWPASEEKDMAFERIRQLWQRLKP